MDNNVNTNTNATITGYDPNTGKPIYADSSINSNEPSTQPQLNSATPKKGQVPKIVFIILGVIAAIILLFVILFVSVSANSNKLICKSKEGNITIMYNDKTIVGYTIVGNLDYDLDQQKTVASKLGIDEYITEFSAWYKNNTTGSCTIKKK